MQGLWNESRRRFGAGFTHETPVWRRSDAGLAPVNAGLAPVWRQFGAGLAPVWRQFKSEMSEEKIRLKTAL